MALRIQQWESNISRRIIPIWCVGSNGTSVATHEAGGQPTFMMGGVYKGSTNTTLSAISANAGEYYVPLTASEVSLLGQGAVYFSSTTALEVAVPFEVVADDPYGSMLQVSSGRTLTAASTTTATLNSAETGTNDWANGAFIAIQLHSGIVLGNVISDSTGTVVQFQNAFPSTPASGDTYVILPGTVDNFSGISIAPAPGTYSAVTVQINGIAPGNYSGVTTSGVTASVNLDKTGYTIAANDYSSTVTFGVGGIKAGTYSGVTLGVGTIAAGTYSGVTVGVGGIAPATYSGVTVGISAIAAGTYSGVTTSGFDSAGNQAAANSLLSTNLGNTRLVQEAFFALRNKVDATGSVGTVYKTDDATSAFTFSYATTTNAFNKVDPT